MSASDTCHQIVEAADALFYARGFEATAFADIAAEVGISRGNFYYHFRTKDEILDAVIGLRIERTRHLLADWERTAETPQERLRAFAGMLMTNRAKIMLHGCPVGTLCTELAKLEHLALDHATALFTLFRTWLARQFSALGRDLEADHLALHLLMRSQGVASLATALHDEVFIAREVEAMERWIDAQRPPLSPEARV